MRENTFRKSEFISANVFWLVLCGLLYGMTLFRRIGNLTRVGSWLVLAGFAAGTCFIAIRLQFRSYRNLLSIVANMEIAFGVYTLITYWRDLSVIYMIAMLSVYAVLIVFNTITMMQGTISGGRMSPALFRFRVAYSVRMAHLLLGAFLSGFIITCLGYQICFNHLSIVDPLRDDEGVIQTSVFSKEEATFNAHLDKLLRLRQVAWIDLSLEDRLIVLQGLADIERDALGIPHDLTVVAPDNMRRSVGGYYNDSRHEIAIRKDIVLNNKDLWYCVNAVAHEARHAYQYRLVDLYEGSENTNRDLLPMREAAIFEAEFRNYIDIEDDFEGYYNQKCEIDARDYADQRENEYRERIAEFLIATGRDATEFLTYGDANTDDTYKTLGK